MNSSLISIIVPCYNAAKYLNETLTSILSQDLCDMEVLIIDDGSTDHTKEVIEVIKDERVKYFYQNNKGVSIARNEGLKMAKGSYIIFFDADDLMCENFIAGRLSPLIDGPDFGFSYGKVIKFNIAGKLDDYYRGADDESDVLLYRAEVITCPSNYMFKKSFLDKNRLSFNRELASTADRFFLVECFKYGKGRFISNCGNLLYRLSENSMSATLNLNLVRDNERFYKLLNKHELIPKQIRNKSLFLGNYILFASYWKINFKLRSLKFAIQSLVYNPIMFIRKLI
jgi:glycosyltransferase involved in cell wall biosynthesis